jgi:hypothetical protein
MNRGGFLFFIFVFLFSVTVFGDCDLVGDNPPCDSVSLSEVVSLVGQWIGGNNSLGEVIVLINAWAGTTVTTTTTTTSTTTSTLASVPRLTISLSSPDNGTNTTQRNLSFNYTVSGSNGTYNCSLFLNGSVYNSSRRTLNNTLSKLNVTNLGFGTWRWNITCNINLTVSNTSQTRIITIQTTTTTTSTTTSSTTTTLGGGINITQAGWWPYGPTEFFAIQNNYLYTISGDALVIIDISTPDSPVKKGELAGAGYPYAGGPTGGNYVAVSGDYYYAAQDGEGLVIANVSDQNNPTLVTRYKPAGLSIGPIAVQGNYTYLSTSQGLKIVNVSNPSSPGIVGSLGGFGEGGVIVSGNYAYYDYDNTVKIINVTNPANPRLVSTYTASSTTYSLALNGDLLFASGYGGPLNQGFVDIVNVSNPASPSKKSTYTDGLANSYSTVTSWSHYLVAAAHDNGVYFVDISNPSSPTQISVYEYYAGYPKLPTVSGNYLYMSLHYGGIEVVNITNPASPESKAVYHPLIGFPTEAAKTIPIYGRSFRVAANNSVAAVVDDKGILVINVSNPAAPQLKSYTDFSSRGFNIAMKGNLVFAALSWGGLGIINISNPANPVVLYHYDPDQYVMSLYVKENYLYLGESNGWDGIRVYNISNPSSITLLGSHAIPRTGGSPPADIVGDMVVSGNYLYLADYENGLRIFDVSNPASIIQVGDFNDSNSRTMGVDVSGNYAYVSEVKDQSYWASTYGVGLRIIDVSDPAHPTLKGSTPGQDIMGGYESSAQVIVSGNYAYMSTGDEGVKMMDISNPASPVEVADYDKDDEGVANGIALADGYVYLANFGGGLEILSAE